MSREHFAQVPSCSVVSDSLRPYGWQPAKLLSPGAFSRQEHWSELPCPSQGDLPNPGIQPASLMSPALVSSLPLVPPGKPVHKETVKIRSSKGRSWSNERCPFTKESHSKEPELLSYLKRRASRESRKQKAEMKTLNSYHYDCSVEGGKSGSCWSNPGHRGLGFQMRETCLQI